MNRFQLSILEETKANALVAVNKQSPVEYCEENIQFNEKDYKGPFSTIGREYLRFPTNLIARRDISDIVCVWGSQTLKTTMLMAANGWAIKNDPCNLLWFFPTNLMSRSFSKNRYQPMINSSPDLARLKSDKRHKYNIQDMEVGAAGIVLQGTGSANQIKSTPGRRVFLDEVESFIQQETSSEADPLNLAEQRTKGQSCPQRWKTSTPSVIEGLIWQELLKGSMHRYAGRCYHCQKLVIIIWNKRFTVLDLTGNEGEIVWDREAKHKDGTWDYDRVVRSARLKCPHCGGDNVDSKKTQFVRNGEWIQTNPGAPASFISTHLPSMYSCLPETSYGMLAKKFIEQKHSLKGLQGFINGDLAEPYMSQDRLSERTELISDKMRVEVTAEWKMQLTIDCQARAPYFWYVKRAWNGGNSEGVEFGSADTWDDLISVQHKAGSAVADVGVGVDAGFGSRSEAEVFKECVSHGEIIDRSEENADGETTLLLPVHVGWTPMRGNPGRKRWKNDKGLYIPWFLRPTDPYIGTSLQGKLEMNILEFAGDYFKDVLEGFRRGVTKEGGDKDNPIKGFTWKVAKGMDNELYWRHMDAEIKMTVLDRRTNRVASKWVPRGAKGGIGTHVANHGFDCEVMQCVKAAFFEYFPMP
jgi:hypothetical protein